MSLVRCHLSISLDGFAAGPNQSPENPLGEGGEGLHDWAVVTPDFKGCTAGRAASATRTQTSSSRPPRASAR